MLTSSRTELLNVANSAPLHCTFCSPPYTHRVILLNVVWLCELIVLTWKCQRIGARLKHRRTLLYSKWSGWSWGIHDVSVSCLLYLLSLCCCIILYLSIWTTARWHRLAYLSASPWDIADRFLAWLSGIEIGSLLVFILVEARPEGSSTITRWSLRQKDNHLQVPNSKMFEEFGHGKHY